MIFSPLSVPQVDGRRLSIEQQGDQLNIDLEGRFVGALVVATGGQRARLMLQPCEVEQVKDLTLAALHAAFLVHPVRELALSVPGQAQVSLLLREGLAVHAPDSEVLICPQHLFRQHPQPWLAYPPSSQYPLQYRLSNGKRHPQRAPRQPGTVYRRYVAEIAETISLRTLDPQQDLEVFSRWQNDPRVAAFWEMTGSQQAHREYLDALLADPKVHPLIACFNDEPFAYFEAYWAREDRIAPYYDVQDYDRGVHMLVGEQRYRGAHRVSAWLSSLAHFLFLDDARTQRVVAEPRADNAKMINYLQRAGFYREKEFDFPHKRAAMMILPREVFFADAPNHGEQALVACS